MYYKQRTRSVSGNVVSDINAEYLWHKLDVETTDAATITSSTDSLTATSYDMVDKATGGVTRTTLDSLEAADFDGSSYLDTSLEDDDIEAIFQSTFSVSMQIWPDDGQPAGVEFITHTAETGEQFRVFLRTGGTIEASYLAPGASQVNAETNSAVFSNGAQSAWTHLVVKVVSGDQIYIIVDGVEQTLSVSKDGDMTGVTMSNFNLDTLNPSTIRVGGEAPSGSGRHFNGAIRNFIIQPVNYTTQNITDLGNL